MYLAQVVRNYVNMASSKSFLLHLNKLRYIPNVRVFQNLFVDVETNQKLNLEMSAVELVWLSLRCGNNVSRGELRKVRTKKNHEEECESTCYSPRKPSKLRSAKNADLNLTRSASLGIFKNLFPRLGALVITYLRIIEIGIQSMLFSAETTVTRWLFFWSLT